MALNGISTMTTKELRQKAKLDQAAIERAAVGNPRAIYDISQLPTQYDNNDIIDNPNITGGAITSITITTPYTRLDGGNYLTPANVSVSFTSAGQTNFDTGQPANAFTEATATPVIVAGNLSGITIVTGGLGYQKYTGPGLQNGRIMADIFVTDSTSGSPDTREIKIRTDLNITVNASNISASGLVVGRPWTI